MDNQRLEKIRTRLEGATPTDLEPTFRDEVWFIRHIEEIIEAYRQDIPDLLDALQAAEQEATKARELLYNLLEYYNLGIYYAHFESGLDDSQHQEAQEYERATKAFLEGKE